MPITTQPQLDLARAIAKQIDEHPELHSQADWSDETSCGTAHCIAGWAGALTPGVELDGSDFVHREGQGYQPVADFAVEALGLSRIETEVLFYEMDNGRARELLDLLIEEGETRLAAG